MKFIDADKVIAVLNNKMQEVIKNDDLDSRIQTIICRNIIRLLDDIPGIDIPVEEIQNDSKRTN